MAAGTKAIKTRIKSVKNTKKITKAMEMVSAAKMRRSVDSTLSTRVYANASRELLQRLSGIADIKSDLLRADPVQKLLVILVSSNRGLCGSFNSNLFRKTALVLADKKNIARHHGLRNLSGFYVPEVTQIDIIGIGRRSATFAKRYGYNLVAVFDTLSEKPGYEDVLPIAQMAMGGFIEKKYDKVVIAFTEYESSLRQVPKLRQLLPLSPIDLEKTLHEASVEMTESEAEAFREEYVFEPNISTIAASIIPRLIEIQVFHSILESLASEHSARMLAMKNASDAAGDMISELTLVYNKNRQAAITQEIAEIVGGAVALS